MRRTSFFLAIVAMLLGAPARGQEAIPLPAGQVEPSGGQPPLQPQPDPASGASETVWGQPQGYLAPTDPAVDEANGLGPCCERTGEGYCCPKDWYVDQRLRIMHHPMPLGVPIGRRGDVIRIFNGITFESRFFKRTAMSTRAATFDPEGGYEITIGRYLGRDADNRDQFVEFTYYGLHAWQGNARLLSSQDIEATSTSAWPNASNLAANQTLTTGNLFSAFSNNVGGFNRADWQEIHYKSRWDNYELNLRVTPRQRRDRLILEPSGYWRREAQDDCRLSWLGGLRVISLDESFRFDSAGHHVLTTGGVDTEYDVAGLYDVRTRNDLLGLQIGGEITKRYGLATCGMRAKAAMFMNLADSRSHIRTTGADDDLLSTVPDFDVQGLRRSRGAAGLAEFGFLASYHLRHNIIAHAAYDLMWISGLALAPEQIQAEPANPSRIDSGGVQMFQSVSLGLEITW